MKFYQEIESSKLQGIAKYLNTRYFELENEVLELHAIDYKNNLWKAEEKARAIREEMDDLYEESKLFVSDEIMKKNLLYLSEVVSNIIQDIRKNCYISEQRGGNLSYPDK